MTRAEESVDEGRMSLYEHLAELRRRIVWSVVAVAAGMGIAAIFYDEIFSFLQKPYCTLPAAARQLDGTSEECRFLVTQVLEAFSTYFLIIGVAGITIAFPFLLWQLWAFIAPGLYSNEKRYAASFVVSGALLFLLGAGLAYWSVPRALAFLSGIGGAQDNYFQAYSIQSYLNFLVKMLLGFGLGFQFPILLIFLQMLGVLHPMQLKAVRRYAIVGIVVLVAVLTPSGDPITLGVLSVPMYLFYEVAILIGVMRHRNTKVDIAPVP